MRRRLNHRREHFAPHFELLFTNPTTGLNHFGEFPKITYRSDSIPSGLIKLHYGEHWGVNSGYGVHHIMQEHRSGIQSVEGSLVKGVVHFVSDILQPGADVHCEFCDIKGNHRPLVVRRPRGYVVLMPRRFSDEPMYYSVVTAIPNANAKGPRVGRL